MHAIRLSLPPLLLASCFWEKISFRKRIIQHFDKRGVMICFDTYFHPYMNVANNVAKYVFLRK